MSNEEFNVPKLLNRAMAATKVARLQSESISDYELALVREMLFALEQQVGAMKKTVTGRISDLQKTA